MAKQACRKPQVSSCTKLEYGSDSGGYEHYLSSSENKA